jgi:general secretion pathway protein B
MSYILDALRKSDQLRRRNAAPTLLPGLAAAAEAKPAPLLAYGVLALVLLAAGIAIGWLRPWQPPAAKPAPLAEAVKPEPVARPAPQPGATGQAAAQTPGAEPAAQAAPAAPAAARPAHTPAPAVAVEAHGTPRPPVAAMESRSAPPASAASAAVQPAPAIAAPVPDKVERGGATAVVPVVTIVMNMADLPMAIQQELPAMSISVHAYSSNAADRLVGVNGRLLHEGDTVAPGLTLEQITPAGMILSYKGYIFRHGVR